MLKIERKDKESIDSMLKRYKRKVKNTKLIRDLKDRQQYEKPSSVKRKKNLKAQYIEQLKSKSNKD